MSGGQLDEQAIQTELDRNKLEVLLEGGRGPDVAGGGVVHAQEDVLEDLAIVQAFKLERSVHVVDRGIGHLLTGLFSEIRELRSMAQDGVFLVVSLVTVIRDFLSRQRVLEDGSGEPLVVGKGGEGAPADDLLIADGVLVVVVHGLHSLRVEHRREDGCLRVDVGVSIFLRNARCNKEFGVEMLVEGISVEEEVDEGVRGEEGVGPVVGRTLAEAGHGSFVRPATVVGVEVVAGSASFDNVKLKGGGISHSTELKAHDVHDFA